MKKITRAGITGAAAAVLVFTGAGTANAAPASSFVHPVGAVFVQTDGLSGNAVVAYERHSDGSLHQAGRYATGGLGLALTGSVVDHLASEGSLAQHDGELFAVNAGSDSITVFGEHGSRLHRRQVIGSGGVAPVSITAWGDRVFVLNARDGGSIQGYRDLDGHLVSVPSWHRDLGLDPNAAPEFTHTPGQISFTPDGSKLVITTKGNTSAFDVFTLGRHGLAAEPVVTVVAGAVPFGFQFDAAGRLIASEAGPNAVASFTIHRDGTVTADATETTGQKATCWIVVDGPYVYASNAGSGTLSGYRLGHHGALTALGTTPTDAGTVDAAATRDGRYLYVQTGAAGSVDEFRVAGDGALTRIGTVTAAGAVGGGGGGGEGIVAN